MIILSPYKDLSSLGPHLVDVDLPSGRDGPHPYYIGRGTNSIVAPHVAEGQKKIL